MTLKIKSRSLTPYLFSIMPKCSIHVHFIKNLLTHSGNIDQKSPCGLHYELFFCRKEKSKKMKEGNTERRSFINMVVFVFLLLLFLLLLLLSEVDKGD